MKRFTVVLAVLLIASILLLPQASFAYAKTIYFDDSDPDIMVLGNAAYYEIGFRKSNGSIAYVIDKSTDEYITLGSRLFTP